jgi:hypothetical protein
MMVSGWKTSTFSPRVALQKTSRSIMDERRTWGDTGKIQGRCRGDTGEI